MKTSFGWEGGGSIENVRDAFFLVTLDDAISRYGYSNSVVCTRL